MDMEVDEDPRMPVLNTDVLAEIFTHLSYCDRKCAKLVCKKWLEVCRYHRFNTEKIISISYFHAHLHISQIIEAFPEEKLNLKFTDQRFYKHSLEFFKEYGPKIEYLQFYKCDFRCTALPKILSYCANLRELFVLKCDMKYVCRHGDDQCEFVLRWNKTCRMINENLVILHMNENAENMDLAVDDLMFVASVFPNIRSLKISLAEFSVKRNFSTLLKLLETQFQRVETIHVNFPTLDFTINVSALQRLVTLNKLKNVSLSCELIDSIRSESIENGLSCKFWTSLAFKEIIFDMETQSGTQLILLIRELPLLRELEFQIKFAAVDDFCTLFSALIGSNLKSLKIGISVSSQEEFIRQAELRMVNSTKNTTVRSLHIEDDTLTFYPLFVKYFPKADDLYINPVKLTRNFITYPDELLSLCVTIAPELLPSSPSTILSRTSLECLEFLEITYYTKLMFSFYRFPNVKYLKIHFPPFYDDEWESELTHLESVLLQDCPELEGIMFSSEGFRSNIYDLSFQFARKFRNLRYMCLLCIRRANLAKRSDLIVRVRECFDQCPSLKAVWIRTPEFRLYYFFDVITKKYEVFGKQRNLADNRNVPVDLKDLWRKKQSEMRLV